MIRKITWNNPKNNMTLSQKQHEMIIMSCYFGDHAMLFWGSSHFIFGIILCYSWDHVMLFLGSCHVILGSYHVIFEIMTCYFGIMPCYFGDHVMLFWDHIMLFLGSCHIIFGFISKITWYEPKNNMTWSQK
jgi:hypothetical protein